MDRARHGLPSVKEPAAVVRGLPPGRWLCRRTSPSLSGRRSSREMRTRASTRLACEHARQPRRPPAAERIEPAVRPRGGCCWAGKGHGLPRRHHGRSSACRAMGAKRTMKCTCGSAGNLCDPPGSADQSRTREPDRRLGAGRGGADGAQGAAPPAAGGGRPGGFAGTHARLNLSHRVPSIRAVVSTSVIRQ